MDDYDSNFPETEFCPECGMYFCECEFEEDEEFDLDSDVPDEAG